MVILVVHFNDCGTITSVGHLLGVTVLIDIAGMLELELIIDNNNNANKNKETTRQHNSVYSQRRGGRRRRRRQRTATGLGVRLG
jgi:hypothetical protein